MTSAIEGRSILLARIHALIQESDRAKKTVEQIDPNLGRRVQGPLFDRLAKHREDLKRLRQDVKNDLPLKGCWSSFRDTQERSQLLFRECLTLLEGSLVRGFGLDDGLCQIADALLYDLSIRANIDWGRFTILAGEELINIEMAEIIRVRFPEVSIWNLPVAAHEFGHFVGGELSQEIGRGHRHPFTEFLEKECRHDQQCYSFLHEHFADLFATYALGPAYASTCILLRFDPWIAYQDKRQHPSDAKRVYWILRVLKKMDATEGGVKRSYTGIIKHLKAFWESFTAEGDPERLEERLGKDTIAGLDRWLEELYFQVDNRQFGVSGVRYGAEDWLRARQLSQQLPANAPLELADDYTLIDVLNAAWWSRMQPENQDSARVQWIGERAVECCHKIGGIPDD